MRRCIVWADGSSSNIDHQTGAGSSNAHTTQPLGLVMLLQQTAFRCTFDFSIFVFTELHCNDICMCKNIRFLRVHQLWAASWCSRKLRSNEIVSDNIQAVVLSSKWCAMGKDHTWTSILCSSEWIILSPAWLLPSSGSVESFKSASSSRITSNLSSGQFLLQKRRFMTGLIRQLKSLIFWALSLYIALWVLWW